MVKKLLSFAVILTVCAGLAACAGNTAPTQADETEIAVNATGYPSNEFPEASVFFDGMLYFPTYRDEDLYSDGAAAIRTLGLTPCGTVTAQSNTAAPDEEFEASHLKIGTQLYRGEADALYVLRGDGALQRFALRMKIQEIAPSDGSVSDEPTYGFDDPVEPPLVEK